MDDECRLKEKCGFHTDENSDRSDGCFTKCDVLHYFVGRIRSRDTRPYSISRLSRTDHTHVSVMCDSSQFVDTDHRQTDL